MQSAECRVKGYPVGAIHTSPVFVCDIRLFLWGVEDVTPLLTIITKQKISLSS